MSQDQQSDQHHDQPDDQPHDQPMTWTEARRRAAGETEAIKLLLRHFGLRPQKGFGQHFLREERYLARIVQASELGPSDQVVEVGPGLGILTRELASHAGRVVAVEIDRGIAAALSQVLADTPNVEIVNGDILNLDPAELACGRPYKVIANLPYYITSSVLRHFLEAAVRPSLLVVMVQREVAERMIARPGKMNLLAIGVQFYGKPRIVSLVPAQAFYPSPKVDSAVVRIDVFDKPAADVDADKFFRLVQAGFSAPRKQLHNSISQRIWLPPGSAPKLLQEAGIDSMRRAQTLRIEEWAQIVRHLEEQGYL